MNQSAEQFLNNAAFAAVRDALRSRYPNSSSDVIPAESKQMELLGAISWYFQWIEYDITEFLVLILGIPEINVLAFTANLSFQKLLQAFSSIAQANKDKFRDWNELKIVIDAAFKAEDVRNGIVHSTWYMGYRYKVRASHKHGVSYQLEDFPVSDIEALLSQIKHVREALSLLHFEYFCNHKQFDESDEGYTMVL